MTVNLHSSVHTVTRSYGSAELCLILHGSVHTVTCSYGSAELCHDHCQFFVSILCQLQGSPLVPAYRHLVLLLSRLMPKMSTEHQVSYCVSLDVYRCHFIITVVFC